uniref:Uncharacterized protein n=1 Tax=Amphimedon queenslandica TaxID=400682 RepID=A0A1X7TTU8_AMPQE
MLNHTDRPNKPVEEVSICEVLDHEDDDIYWDGDEVDELDGKQEDYCSILATVVDVTVSCYILMAESLCMGRLVDLGTVFSVPIIHKYYFTFVVSGGEGLLDCDIQRLIPYLEPHQQ